MLREAGDKISAADRAAIESAISDLKTSIEQNDLNGMKKRMEALNQAQHKAAEAMYRSASGGAGQPGGTSGQPGPQPGGSDRPAGDVIDAEVVEEEKR
jgi:molecular chaperone DnaK